MLLRRPHFAGTLSLLAVTGLFLAGTGRLCAQRQNNFKQLNSQFSTGSATGVFLEPDQVMGTGLTGAGGMNSKFIGRLPGSLTAQLNTGFSESLPSINQPLSGSRATMPANTFSTNFSSLNGDMNGSPLWRSNFPLGRNFPIKMTPSANLRQPQMSSTLQRNSSLNDYSAYDRWKSPTPASSKFTDAFVFHTVDNSKQLQQVGRELSLQDINRYQFQGEFSSNPGLPVTHAGGEVDQVASNNGQILHTPKLFDFNPSLTNSIPSGASVAPRIITSNGSEPYLPGTPASSGTNAMHSLMHNNSAPAQTTTTTNIQTAPANTTTTHGEIPKDQALLPQGKYQYTTPDGKQLPVELGAPEVVIQTEN